MSISTMIIGESGTGKTTSLMNLDPSETLLIQSIRKPLPFRAKGWSERTKEHPNGSIWVCDESSKITVALDKTDREIIVIDDFQAIMSTEFMKRSHEVGFQKFTDIARHAWDILTAASNVSGNKRIYILAHSASDETGRIKAKTIGKMLDEKITIEGLLTIVLRTAVVNGNYLFTTQNSGADTVKSPIGMFADDTIPNDLAAVDAAICEYYEINQPVTTKEIE